MLFSYDAELSSMKLEDFLCAGIAGELKMSCSGSGVHVHVQVYVRRQRDAHLQIDKHLVPCISAIGLII